MSAYQPTLEVLLRTGLLIGAVVLLGFLWTRIPRPEAKGRLMLARILAWGTAVLSVVLADRWVPEPAGFRMLALITPAFLGMKSVVAVEERYNRDCKLSFLSWLIFSLTWFGMRPALFARPRQPDLPEGTRLLKLGLSRFALGAAFIAGAIALYRATGSHWAATVLLLPGISLCLHFGLLNLSAGALRCVGYATGPLFKAPLLAKSLSEFWGRRWNLAFSEMTSIAVYRPLGGVIGRQPAALVAFLVSGLLHEMALSVPVRAGYGLPMLFFGVHGALTVLEKKTGWSSQILTILSLILPMPLLFHPPFLRAVLWPVLGP